MCVNVEPGVVLDRLNAHLKPLGLMFGPDVSTSDRATIGGMLGNNSAGARSLRYGKTVDHVRAVDVVLADGTPWRFGPVSPEELASLRRRDDTVGRIYRTAADTVETHREAIVARFPHILRRVSGYNLDELVPGLPVRPPGWTGISNASSSSNTRRSTSLPDTRSGPENVKRWRETLPNGVSCPFRAHICKTASR